MLISNFVDSVCGELQQDDVEFRKEILSTILPSAEDMLLSIYPDGNIFNYNAKVRDIYGTERSEFLLPSNYKSIRKLLLDGEEKYYSDDADIDDEAFSIPDRKRIAKHDYPLMVANIYNANLRYTRTASAGTLVYKIQALDISAYMASTDPNKQIVNFFYDIGEIYDNDNVWLRTAEIKEYTIIRIYNSPNVYVNEEDEIWLMTDYGEIRIKLLNTNQYIYIAEDGSTYQYLLNSMVLDTLVNRSTYKHNFGIIHTYGQDLNAEISVEYNGKSFPYYHFNDDCIMLDKYNKFIRLYVLVEGAKFFKMAQEYATYKSEYNEIVSQLIRDANIRNNKGKVRTFRPVRMFGTRPMR